MTWVAKDGPEDNIMSIQNNTFCWHGISSDLETGPAFYAHVLGWKHIAEDGGSPMFVAPGGPVAHIQPVDQGPAAWCSFLSVEDVDASTIESAEAGGSVLVQPTDLPAGRFSVVASPSGAVFGLYQAVEADEMAAPGSGTIHWVELQSTSVEADLEWLTEVFGFSVRTQQMASGPYHVLEADGTPRGGVTPAQQEISAFIAWVQVDDLDSALTQVGSGGGKALTPAFADPDVGRMAVVSDPSGATFGLVQPA